MTTGNNIVRLNDWISYDTTNEKFILAEYTIKIEGSEFNIDDMQKVGKQRKKELKEKMQILCSENGIIEDFKRIYSKNQKTGNTGKRNFKNSIENLILRHSGILKEFDLIGISKDGVRLKQYSDTKN